MLVHNLPAQPTPFIGREVGLAEICDVLASSHCRLLTLAGPGGIGKTRLALEAARLIVQEKVSSVDFSHGVYFVPLQPLTSIEFIGSAIAHSLKFTFYDERDPREQLLDYLSDKQLLLLLDNFEHLLDGVDLIPDILANAPAVKLLVTSRERLRLREEWVQDIHGLPFPAQDDIDAGEHYTAIQLFIQRARQSGYTLKETDSAAIACICRLVEGIPLAIELAAAWTRTLPCDAIAREIEGSLDILTTNLRNVPEKHRSMHTVFEHSWKLLSNDEQSVFRKLSVFRGGFWREAAEQVAGASLAILSSLVDSSLLWVDGDGRYSTHELLRQFGAVQLDRSPDEASQTRDLHCTYYAEFMESQWPRLSGSEIKSALTDITTELDNVRTSWDWGIKHHKTAEINATLHSLWFYYGVSILYQEGEQAFARATPAFSDDVALHGRLMAHWGELSWPASFPAKARSLLKESLRLLRQAGARQDIAFTLYRLALVELTDPQMPVSDLTVDLEESLAIYTELDDFFGMGEVLFTWGLFHRNQYVEQRREGALLWAQQYYKNALIAYRQMESLFGIAVGHWVLSESTWLQGNFRQSFEEAQTGLKIFQNLGIPWGIRQTLNVMGYAAYELGDLEEARRVILETLRMLIESGYRVQYAPHGSELILKSLHLFAAILVKGRVQVRAYELLGFVEQQLSNFQITPDNFYFSCLSLLDENLSPHLAEAVERGRARDIETVVKEVMADLSEEHAEPQSSDDLLTEREIEIIRLIADGLNTREAAERIHLSVTTVRWYLRQIYSKLDVHSRAELIARARELELLP